MNKSFAAILICCSLVGTIVAGCKTRDVRQTLKKMMQTEIKLPERIVKVTGAKVDTVSLEFSKPLMIIWTDSLQCGSCRVNQLQKYLELYAESKKNDAFELMILFSPARKDYKYISHMLSARKFSFPVYIDVNGEFPLINTIPNAPEYHSFLLDQRRMPTYVGDPTTNNKLWSLFCAVVENNNNNQNI